MGTVDIDIDANVDGQNCKFKFSWEGDDAIRNVMNEVKDLAARTGITPKQLTHEMLRSLRSRLIRAPSRKKFRGDVGAVLNANSNLFWGVYPGSAMPVSERGPNFRCGLPAGPGASARTAITPAVKLVSLLGTKRTWHSRSAMSAFGGKADMTRTWADVRF
jgi:hypothetical protein